MAEQQRREMALSPFWLQASIITFVVGFTILGILAYVIYHDQPPIPERVVNPVGHFVARLLERPGEILTEAPDAVFRPLFTAQGMTREARTIAAEAGLRGRNAA
ncbi:MAG TPA: hypothetical protein PLZ94_19525, partial [Armatimonadota bacterium]|nr:hypothetical protein [Armatimonadota bacterium]